jgi:hypothetical protein
MKTYKEFMILNEAFRLSPGDKKVVNFFTSGKILSSNKLMSDGNRLDGRWMGGNGIATWENGKIVFGDLGSKAAQVVQTAIRKSAPKNDILEGFESLRTPVDKLYQGENAYAASKGYKQYAGGCGFKDSRMDLSLYFPTGDQAYIKDALQKPLKSGEVIFRYTTPRVKAAGMIILVKINVKKGLIYYNKPEASDEDILDWEGRGQKLRYINLRDDWKKFLKGWMRG